MPHLYKVGQMLELRSAPRHSNRPSGPCEVIAQLPNEAGPALYRVKSLGEANERVVEEIDLSPSAAVKADKLDQDGAAAFSIAVSKR